jgi:hypothetical protein
MADLSCGFASTSDVASGDEWSAAGDTGELPATAALSDHSVLEPEPESASQFRYSPLTLTLVLADLHNPIPLTRRSQRGAASLEGTPRSNPAGPTRRASLETLDEVEADLEGQRPPHLSSALRHTT